MRRPLVSGILAFVSIVVLIEALAVMRWLFNAPEDGAQLLGLVVLALVLAFVSYAVTVQIRLWRKGTL